MVAFYNLIYWRNEFFFEGVSSDRDKEVLKNKIKIVPFCAAQGMESFVRS